MKNDYVRGIIAGVLKDQSACCLDDDKDRRAVEDALLEKLRAKFRFMLRPEN